LFPPIDFPYLCRLVPLLRAAETPRLPRPDPEWDRAGEANFYSCIVTCHSLVKPGNDEKQVLLTFCELNDFVPREVSCEKHTTITEYSGSRLGSRIAELGRDDEL